MNRRQLLKGVVAAPVAFTALPQLVANDGAALFSTSHAEAAGANAACPWWAQSATIPDTALPPEMVATLKRIARQFVARQEHDMKELLYSNG